MYHYTDSKPVVELTKGHEENNLHVVTLVCGLHRHHINLRKLDNMLAIAT